MGIKHHSFKVSKTVALPEYGKIVHKDGCALFKLSNKRKELKCGPLEEDFFDLGDKEVFYETIFGWGVVIDYETMEQSIQIEGTPFVERTLVGITEAEYGDGTF